MEETGTAVHDVDETDAYASRSARMRARRKASGQRVKHPEEWGQRRKLLLDPDNPIPVHLRLGGADGWGILGAALRSEPLRSMQSAKLVVSNDSYNCMDLSTAFATHTAFAARPLVAAARSRLVLEIFTDVDAPPHIAQVGIAQLSCLHPEREEASQGAAAAEVLASVAWRSDGDVESIGAGSMAVLAEGASEVQHATRGTKHFELGRLHQRQPWLCGGAPKWLGSALRGTSRLHLEVDLLNGRMAFSTEGWWRDPAVLCLDGLAGTSDLQWFPFVSLTALGQHARIVDIHVRADG
mmetsp:Transcript_64873/g.120693  ORF Transcript_64873/g.120693 Transcript_64873/m.120693 type:complete len:296 (-) Transcript_64873:32-919(-)